jgi:DNA-binding response OmpR family regulator
MRKEILVIDGSKAIRFLIKTIFSRHYKVVTVADGVGAMQYLRRHQKPHLMIVSPELDDMADWELIRHLSLSPLYNEVPLIVISSQPEDMLQANVMKYNAVECFSKPFDPLKLIATVDSLLLGSRMHKI